MNMFKKNGGFTLVELIVVIAILAILAGVAVPAYSGYIAKAKQAQQLINDDYNNNMSAVNGILGQVSSLGTIPTESLPTVAP